MDRKKFIKKYRKSKDYPKSGKQLGCKGPDALTSKICRRNVSRTNPKREPFKKSVEGDTYDFKGTTVAVSARNHDDAVKTAPGELVDYLNNSIDSELEKIPFEKGLLTVSKKERALYSAFFQDRDGQVIETFENVTIPMLAKALVVRDLYTAAKSEAPAKASSGETISIKYGDLEIDIRKSVQDFVKAHKASKGDVYPDYMYSPGIPNVPNRLERGKYSKSKMSKKKKEMIKKAVKAWMRNSREDFKSIVQAAEELSSNWEYHREEFQQIIHAMKQMGRDGKR